MVRQIAFTDFHISVYEINVTCLESKGGAERSSALYFRLNPPHRPHNDLIALALATLCGEMFNKILIDLPLSAHMHAQISKFTKASLSAASITDSKPTYCNVKKDQVVLNFSGGLDSLALLALLPKDTALVSLDFGGLFTREERFFKEFKPYTVTTNLVTEKYNINSVAFMGIAAILYQELIRAEFYAYGTVYETSPLRIGGIGKFDCARLPHGAYGGMDIPLAYGLTTVATAKIVCHYFPDLMKKSLISLGNPGSEKHYRKQMIVSALARKNTFKADIGTVAAPSGTVPFGKNFEIDFLSLYIAKYMGISATTPLVVDIPASAIQLIAPLALDFYERLHPAFVSCFPASMREDFLSKMADAQVYEYVDNDWNEFIKVLEYLAKYHPHLTAIIENARRMVQDARAHKAENAKHTYENIVTLPYIDNHLIYGTKVYLPEANMLLNGELPIIGGKTMPLHTDGDFWHRTFPDNQASNHMHFLGLDWLHKALLAYEERRDAAYLDCFNTYLEKFLSYAETLDDLGGFASADNAIYMRTIILLKALTLLGGEWHLRGKVATLLKRQGDWMYMDQNHADNNHGLFSDFGLAHLAILFRRYDFAQIWMDRAIRRVGKLFSRSFDSDGMNNENSISYAVYNITVYQSILKFFDHYGTGDSLESIRAGLDQAILAVKYLVWQNGYVPPIGDSPVYNSRYESINQSRHFPHEHFALIKNELLYLSLKCGYTSLAHKHVDEGSITLRYNGVEFIVDSGRYNYDSNDLVRKYIISSRGHSGFYPVSMDNMSIWTFHDLCTYAGIDSYQTQDGATRVLSRYELENGTVQVTREMIYKDMRITLIDTWKSVQAQPFRLRFVLHPDLELCDSSLQGEKCALFQAHGHLIRFQSISFDADFSFELGKGYYSNEYNLFRETKTLDALVEASQGGYMITDITFGPDMGGAIGVPVPNCHTEEYQSVVYNADTDGKYYPDKFGTIFSMSIRDDSLSIAVTTQASSEPLAYAYYIYCNGQRIHEINYISDNEYSVKLTQYGSYYADIFVKRAKDHYRHADLFRTKLLDYRPVITRRFAGALRMRPPFSAVHTSECVRVSSNPDIDGKVYTEKFCTAFTLGIWGGLLWIEVNTQTDSDELDFAYYIYRGDERIATQNYIPQTHFALALTDAGDYCADIFVKRRRDHYRHADIFRTKTLAWGGKDDTMVLKETPPVVLSVLHHLLLSSLALGCDIWGHLRERGYEKPALYSDGTLGSLVWHAARHSGVLISTLLSAKKRSEMMHYPRGVYVDFADCDSEALPGSADVILWCDDQNTAAAQKLKVKYAVDVLFLSDILNELYITKLIVEPFLDIRANNPGVHIFLMNRADPRLVKNPSQHERSFGTEGKDFAKLLFERLLNPKPGEERTPDPVWGIHGLPDDYILAVGGGSLVKYEKGIAYVADRTSKYTNVLNGFRVTTDVPEHYRGTVYLFGASVIFGLGASDEHTIASALQRILNDNGIPYAVKNCSNYGANDDDRQIELMRSMRFEPGDIIVSLMMGDDRVNMLAKHFPLCNVRPAFDRPHDMGEVFYEFTHLNFVGYNAIAKELFRTLDEYRAFDSIRNDVCTLIAAQEASPLKADGGTSEYGDHAELAEFLSSLAQKAALDGLRTGAIVMNCNPFTLGHRHLIEYAASRVRQLYIFVVEEDRYFFPFADRIEMVRRGTADMENVTVLPGGSFIISQRTFAAYSKKEELQDQVIDPSMDVTLFAQKIAPILGITVRFAGEEPLDNVTRQYNDAMRRILPLNGIQFDMIPRKENGGAPISASRVRKLLESKDFTAIAEIVPPTTLNYLFDNYGGEQK